MSTKRQPSFCHLLACLCIGIWSAGFASADIDPQAERGDALFKDGSDGLSLYQWGIPLQLNPGHAAVYYGYYQFMIDGQYRHMVIQARGDNYAIDYSPFDYTPAWPTFIGEEPSSYNKPGLGPRTSCSHGTWKPGMACEMTPAARDVIITEAKRLIGVAYPWWSIVHPPNLWEPTSLDPRSTFIGTPTAMRCDGLVEWVYEKAGFNTCNNTASFDYDYGYIRWPTWHSADWMGASVDPPSTIRQENDTSFTITASDYSSNPTRINVIWGDGSTGTYLSPLTHNKDTSATIHYQGVDFANNVEAYKTYSYSPSLQASAPSISKHSVVIGCACS